MISPLNIASLISSGVIILSGRNICVMACGKKSIFFLAEEMIFCFMTIIRFVSV